MSSAIIQRVFGSWRHTKQFPSLDASCSLLHRMRTLDEAAAAVIARTWAACLVERMDHYMKHTAIHKQLLPVLVVCMMSQRDELTVDKEALAALRENAGRLA